MDLHVKPLEALGLKKREESLEDRLKALYDKRKEAYKKLDEIDLRVKELEKQNSRIAASDIKLLRKKFNRIQKTIAMIHSSILELETILNSNVIDELADKMNGKIYELYIAIEKLEYAAISKRNVDGIVIRADKINFTDITAPTEITSKQFTNETISEKNINNESENTNLTV